MEACEASIYASPLPDSERSVSLATQGAIETFISQIASERKGSRDSLLDDENQEPDHPCNYCHKYHFFAGPRATPCPKGTKLPSKERHVRGHNRKGTLQHLPNSRCTKCKHKHWVSGSAATPCVLPYHLRRPLSRSSTPLVAVRPDTECKKCGYLHWFSGPYASSCRRSARKAHLADNSGHEQCESTTIHQSTQSHKTIKSEARDDEDSGMTSTALTDSRSTSNRPFSNRHVDCMNERESYDPYPRRATTSFSDSQQTDIGLM